MVRWHLTHNTREGKELKKLLRRYAALPLLYMSYAALYCSMLQFVAVRVPVFCTQYSREQRAEEIAPQVCS